MRITILTLFALLAFASNSILCRLALGEASIDAASFTALRLASGSAVLVGIVLGRRGSLRGSWMSALALFFYAAPFSFAYLSLSAGTGALILFGAVQATMILTGLRGGERPHRQEWTGLVIALAGLVVLVAPGVRAPSPAGSFLMAMAGIAWGVYSLHGRRANGAIPTTAGNFLRCAPLCVILSAILLRDAHLSTKGALLAVLSGGVTSGLGYVVWYAALGGLTATRAATVQLAVPALAAFGGVVLLHERVSLRLLLAAALILGGVGLAVRGRTGAPARAARSGRTHPQAAGKGRRG